MIRTQTARLATGVAAALIGVMLLGVGGATASVPAGWNLTATGIVAQISPNAVQGYTVVISNSGPSNISKLYLTASDVSSGGVGTPISPAYSSLSTPCDTGVNQGCPLGAFPAGSSMTLTLAYTAAASDTKSFIVEFDINTSGYVLGKNSSHGDSFPFSVSTPVNGSPDFAGGWTLGTGTIKTNQSLSKNNVQATSVNPPSAHIPVTVDDSGNTTFDCSTSPNCTNAFGVWSALNVNNGTNYSGGAFQVTLLVLGKSVPGSVSISQLKILHVLDSGYVETLTQTGNACTASPPSATTSDCIASVTKVGSNYQFVLWLVQNGGLRGAY